MLVVVRIALLLVVLLWAVAGRAEEVRPSEGALLFGEVSYHLASPYLVSHAELSGLSGIRTGRPYSDLAVRDAIQFLSSKGIFREIAAYSRKTDNTVDLLFHLGLSPTIAEVDVVGAGAMSQAQIVAASKIRRGASIEDRDLSAAGDSVRDAMVGIGYPDADVVVSASCSLDTGVGRVRIAVVDGPVGLVSDLPVRGNLHFSQDTLVDILGVRPGDSFSRDRWEKGVKMVREAYKKAGFFAVRVTSANVSRTEGGRLRLTLVVEEGPRFVVRFEGNKEVSSDRLAEEAGIFSDTESTESGLRYDARERLVAFYRMKGYLRAEVTADLLPGPSPNEKVLRIVVSEGRKGALVEIVFVGNVEVASRTLRAEMATRPVGSFSSLTGSGKFSPDVWGADLAAIVGYYQRLGYARAKIISDNVSWNAEDGMIRTVRIEEGPRYFVQSIRFRGNDNYMPGELRPLLSNVPGKPLDYTGTQNDQEAVADFYRNAGYLDASVEVSYEGRDSGGEAVLDVNVSEGPRYRLGKVAVRGTMLTDPVVVLRELALKEGDPAGERDLIRFQQAVYSTGLYKSVRVARVADREAGVLDLVAEVEEGAMFEVEFGGGYGTDTGVRAFVGAKNRNLNGRGRSFGGNVYLSQKEGRYILDVKEPWVFGNRYKWDGTVASVYQDSQETSYSIRKASIIGRIDHTLFDRSTAGLQYEFSKNDLYEVSAGAVLAPEDNTAYNISSVRGQFAFDLRNDPFNPTNGNLVSGWVEFASSFLASEVDYLRMLGQASVYVPVFRRSTVVLSAKGAVAWALGETVEVPIGKRFFLGGRSSVRGFSEDSLGPKGGDGTPTGGDMMVNGNAEFRTRLWSGLIGAVFVDAGSLWLRKDPDYGKIDPRYTSGIGLRYVTPVGPLSFDVGWKLNRRAGETPSEWHFSIGSTF